MRLSSIINESSNIVHWDEMSDDYDPWVTMDQAEAIAKNSGIRISSDKNLSLIALNNDQVTGAVWSSVSAEEDQAIYDFDVVVGKDNRNARVGLQLIDAALNDYQYLKSEYDNLYVRVWVVNPKLVRVLENKYGFEITSQYNDGSAHMEYHL